MFTTRYTEAELSDSIVRRTIPPKCEVYYLLLATGRRFTQDQHMRLDLRQQVSEPGAGSSHLAPSLRRQSYSNGKRSSLVPNKEGGVL